MSFSTVLSAVLVGLKVEFVQVEADVSSGLPMFHMVGYLSSEVKEAGERVRTAVKNAGIKLPPKKMVINLSPADVRKRGSSFDLPIAVALLASVGMVQEQDLAQTLFLGELSLDGSIRKVTGILPIVAEAKKKGCKRCVIPRGNAAEGALVNGIKVIGAEHLGEVCAYLNGDEMITPVKHQVNTALFQELKASLLDYSEVHGQEAVKRATEVAVSGNHNILYIGPPGAGKTMLAQRIPTILPPLTLAESIEITKIYSVLGMVDSERPLIGGRPFRNVHHTVTKSALIGGGLLPAPGEVSLASGGVLFLDELAEFQKSVLEVLRQPLEERQIQIIRSRGNYVFPADTMLVAAMNPCPCGNYPDLNRCTCTPGQIRQYLSKISQPFLDRIDLCVEAPRVQYEDLKDSRPGESSASIRERVIRVREKQSHRYHDYGITTNSQLSKKQIEEFCRLGPAEEQLMRQAFQGLSLTARTYHKILKVARTIADMADSDEVRIPHLREAIGYRNIDKKYWGK